ncbi:hypothetical protein U9M48_041283, partial [Paspalum notatum var. saurae]
DKEPLGRFWCPVLPPWPSRLAPPSTLAPGPIRQGELGESIRIPNCFRFSVSPISNPSNSVAAQACGGSESAPSVARGVWRRPAGGSLSRRRGSQARGRGCPGSRGAVAGWLLACCVPTAVPIQGADGIGSRAAEQAIRTACLPQPKDQSARPPAALLARAGHQQANNKLIDQYLQDAIWRMKERQELESAVGLELAEEKQKKQGLVIENLEKMEELKAMEAKLEEKDKLLE